MSNSIELRIPFGLGEILYDYVFQPATHENVAFGLVSQVTLRRRTVLCVRRVICLKESDYIPNSRHGAMWRGSAMFPIMAAAMDENLGIFVFHSHDHVGPPHLSSDDTDSARDLVPMFRKRVPMRPHGTVVLSRTHSAGRVWLPGNHKFRGLTNTRWFGSSITDFPNSGSGVLHPAKEFDRQSLVVGGHGQATLTNARVAVVGAGGGGSHVIQQLAYLGIGEIVVIDPDVYEESNRHRVVCALQSDLGKAKVEIFRRFVKKLRLGGRVRSVKAAIPDATAVEAIRECDLIVGCVDTLFSRADLQELASRYLIPYIDIGAIVRAIPNSQNGDARVNVAGNIFTFVPGNFCMWCSGFLSRAKIDAEQNGPTRGYFEKNNQEAQVVSFNGILGSQAVSEVLQLLTGFRGSGIRGTDLRIAGEVTSRGYKKFDGVGGTLFEWGGTRLLGCEHCNQSLAAGDLIYTPAAA